MKDEGKVAVASRHALDLRMRLPWFNGKFYFVFLVGKDRRLDELPSTEHRQPMSPMRQAVVATTIFAFCAVGGLLLFAAVLYLLKSYAGIDLVHGSSPIPNALRWIGICH